ncbi:Ubiquitin-conjugating enzyme/RWD-like protein [Pleurotus pulmonarius]
MASISARRLAKELREIQLEGCPVGIALVTADDFATWRFSIEVMGESLYEGEQYLLQFRFDSQYPISSPAVQFVVGPERESPIHPHVYSNGHICASILGTEWSPVLSVVAVCVTLQSMLASCKKKERPVDNDRYVRTAPENPKKTRFHYDDDNV